MQQISAIQNTLNWSFVLIEYENVILGSANTCNFYIKLALFFTFC